SGGEFSSDLLRASVVQRASARRSCFRPPHSKMGLLSAALAWSWTSLYAAHQIKRQPRVSLPETTRTLRWTGKVGDASLFRVGGSRAFVRDPSASKLSSCVVPCVFLGFPPDAHGWQFYHPTSRCVLSSQDVTFDESVSYYRRGGRRGCGHPGGCRDHGDRGRGAPGRRDRQGRGCRGGRRGRGLRGGRHPGHRGSHGECIGDASLPEGGTALWASWRFESCESESWGSVGVLSLGVLSLGVLSLSVLSLEVLRVSRHGGSPSLRSGYVSGTLGATGPTAGGASGAGAAGGAVGAGTARAAGPRGAGARGTSAVGGPTGVGAAGGAGAAGPKGARTRGTGAAGASGAAGVGVVGAGAVATGGAAGAGGAGGTGAGGAAGVVAGDPGAEGTGAVSACRPESPVRAVHTGRRFPRQRPPPVPGTHYMTLRPSIAPQRVPLLSPPASSLPDGPDPVLMRGDVVIHSELALPFLTADEADWDEQNMDGASEEAGPLPYCSVDIPMDDDNPRESVNAEFYYDFSDNGYVTPQPVNTNISERIGPNFLPDPETGDEAAYPEDTNLPRYT
ncbi:unnamed protein product, partial [Closterium sp. NIES-53]